MDGSPSGSIILILILVFINAFFAAAEMAIVSVNKTKVNILAEEGNKKAILLKKLLSEPSNFLATIQVGITLAGFFASASAATSISDHLASLLENLKVPYSSQISFVLITLLISYTTLVLGELFPKRVALQNAEKVAMFSVKPIIIVSKVAKPFVKLLSGSTNLLVKISGINTDNLEEKVSKEEIKSLIEIGEEHGVINETEKDMLTGIFEFDNKLAKEVMTPRTEVFMLDIEDNLKNTIGDIMSEKFSRIPVFKDDMDNIIGIIYIKDLFNEIITKGIDNVNLENIIREPYFVPESKNIDVLFKDLQESKNPMAILIDEYGGFSGIVTLEDLIEEVMGSICDEYDEEEPCITKLDNNLYLVDGLLTLDEINEELNLNLQSQTSDTIGGFLIDLLGAIPKECDVNPIKFDNILFKIEKLNEKRVEKLTLQLNSNDTTV